MIVAIDGPAGAGKSTVARKLAERLGVRYVDTGAMYRALTWLALRRGLSLDDESSLAELAVAHPVSLDGERVEIAGHDVSDEIRATGIDLSVSSVARHARVRAVMRERQRELAEAADAVIEGRDIGSVVCPDAEVKVYLDADPAVRARRRLAERPYSDERALAADLRVRDERDAPQTQAAPDAERIDTTQLGIDEVIERIAAIVAARVRA
jgi:cytidylate kinase